MREPSIRPAPHASTRSCLRLNAPAADIRPAAPTPPPSTAARPTSINVLRAAPHTIRALAALLGREFKPLNPANGVESPPSVAWIDEERCIGCARCLPPARSMPSSAPASTCNGGHGPVHGLRAVPAAVPGRLHRDAAGASERRRSACPQPGALRSSHTNACRDARRSGSGNSRRSRPPRDIEPPRSAVMRRS